MTEVADLQFYRKRRELEQLITDAAETLARSSVVLQALKDERVKLIVAHARRNGHD